MSAVKSSLSGLGMSSPSPFWMLSLFPAMTVMGWYCRLRHLSIFCIMGFVFLQITIKQLLRNQGHHIYLSSVTLLEKLSSLCKRQASNLLPLLGQFVILNILYRWLMLISVITIVATVIDNSVTSNFYFPFGYDVTWGTAHPATEKGCSKCGLSSFMAILGP